MPLFKSCSGPISTVFLYIHVCMYICLNCIDMYVDGIFYHGALVQQEVLPTLYEYCLSTDGKGMI